MNIFIFNRGLRLFDNTTLIYQTKQMGAIVPIFIFTPEQIDKKKNKYFSDNSVQFMIESLHELSKDIASYGGKLYFFNGDNIDVLKSIHKDNKILSIGMNFDYTPYARLRSNNIKQFCKDNKIQFYEKEDYLLHSSDELLKKDGTPYLVFTPFKNFCIKSLKVREVDKFKSFKFEKIKFEKIKSLKFEKIKSLKYELSEKEIDKFYKDNPNINIHGGRKNGLKILSEIKKFSTYQKDRDYLTYNTTFLSAHNHYMTISIREEYWVIIKALGVKSQGIILELYWREFYTIVVHHFPHVLEGQLSYLKNTKHQNSDKNKSYKPDKIKYSFNKKWFDAWCNGTTGFPIIDAAMRQLNKTGFMHNRCRMVTMSFLVKLMHIDWRYGEQYFATKLVDYDAMMNNSGCQWCAGCGTDAMLYFRLFNPWTQQKKYDSKCLYIKKYIPELIHTDPKIIHNWENSKNSDINYPQPILDYAEERKKFINSVKS
jgi:deoxyribodipyrimidine photo-lyase